jgi:hemerythrin-like domain-containing protein
MTDAITRLLDEHLHCDALFARTEAAAQRCDWTTASPSFADAETALLGHFTLEEARLFPAFEAATGIVHGPTAVMRDEHAAMRELLENCRSQLAARDRDGFQAELDTLFVMIQQHNVKEENVLYPMCRARVPELDTLLAAAAAA